MSYRPNAGELHTLLSGDRALDALRRADECGISPEGFQGGDSKLTEAVWRLVAAQERTNDLLESIISIVGRRS